MEGKIRELYDEKGYKHLIDPSKEVGEGGQGKVFKSENENILIKLTKIKKPGEVKWKVRRIRSLNLSRHLNFALPLVELKIESGTHEGYIMRIMEGMKEISSLMVTSFADYKDLYKYYDDKTGGIRRRLEILSKIAYNLYAIHSRGIIYGDISPNNIFVSTDKEYCEAWFIDCDNMDYAYNVSETIGSPGFCSPEVRKALPPYGETRQVNTIENDIYAFANLVFHILFLADPFRGSVMQELQDSEEVECAWDDEDDWDDEDNDVGERQFDLGEVSWISEGDPNNKPVFGLSPMIDQMISKELKGLLNNTLGYEGRTRPDSRPSIRIWYEEINNLLNQLVDCECGHSYHHINNSCIRCHREKPNTLRFEVAYDDGKASKVFVTPKESMEIKNSHLGIGRFKDKDRICFELTHSGRRRQIRNKLKNEITIIENPGLEDEYKIKVAPNRREQVRYFEGCIIEINEKNLKVKIAR